MMSYTQRIYRSLVICRQILHTQTFHPILISNYNLVLLAVAVIEQGEVVEMYREKSVISRGVVRTFFGNKM